MRDAILVTAAEAAAAVSLTRDAIYTWVSRGYLAAVPGARRGREKLYRLADVYRCEAERAREHRRKGRQE